MNAIHVAENRTDIRGQGSLFVLSRVWTSYRVSKAGTVAISTPMKENAAMENAMLLGISACAWGTMFTSYNKAVTQLSDTVGSRGNIDSSLYTWTK